MSRRMKITGFARFLIFLIIIVPIALVVSHMANNNWQFDQNRFLEDLNIKPKTEMADDDLLDADEQLDEITDVETAPNPPITTTTTQEQTDINSSDEINSDSLKAMQQYIETLESQLDDAKVEIDDLKNRLYQRDYLMNQIDSLQRVIKNNN